LRTVDGLLRSGMNELELRERVVAPMEALLDSPLEELAETVLPGLPFILIAVGEGRHVFAGRKTMDAALQGGLVRASKSGAAIGVGSLVALLDGGLFYPRLTTTDADSQTILRNRMSAIVGMHLVLTTGYAFPDLSGASG
jgi:hypothetical protein